MLREIWRFEDIARYAAEDKAEAENIAFEAALEFSYRGIATPVPCDPVPPNGEAAALRLALNQERARADQAEAKCNTAQNLAGHRANELAQVQADLKRAEVEIARLRKELNSLTAGGALERALRALMWRLR